MLTEVFKIFADTRSEHEPEPNYARALPDVKKDPRHAVAFLKNKIKTVEGYKEKNYVETSNVFGKGFFIPLARMGFFPKLIFLNREFRKVAGSLYKRGSFPMRTKMGQHFSSDPSYPGSLPIFKPAGLTDYQLCYWGVLDSFYRQLQAEAIYQDVGKEYVWASASDFNDFDLTCSIGERLGLSLADKAMAERRHKEIAGQHHNPNKSDNGPRTEVNFDREEAEVLDRIAFYDPLFVDKVMSSKFFSRELAIKLS
ncbi:hypothetical protein EKK97_13520 [Billgrantia tianxiuensis]|uniref:Sulfotransferase family protein n=1 Tax=Billgrantia tianxiuensis TaxID=2497861 RepID=A0A6I6SPB2_9GAMM|nr:MULTISPECIES: hypothetical protein [Halomonas]MCE8034519.1 hypothetical protein [Halomonas sp. MCCC 1A11057]QHC50396.1 hypothetical protein EKK97_13520 [Halomonas tianxiuensis]